MKNRKICTFLLMLLVCTFIFGAFSITAAEPYQSYTYSSDGFALYSPSAYSPANSYDSQDIFADDYKRWARDPVNTAKPLDLKEPTDMVVDDEGRVYIADPTNNRIVVLNAESYKKEKILDTFDNGGHSDSFSGCQGVFVNEDYIYVCDTNNQRIVVFDRDYKFVKIIGKPTGTLFGAQTQYKPIAMAVDQYGRIFVISSGTYEGVIVMTSEGVFTGYIGAQKGDYNALQIILRRFQTAEQRKNSIQNLSVAYNNITIDEDGFIYVTTDSIDKGKQQDAIKAKDADYSPVKKLNSAGSEIMKRNGFFSPAGEVDVQFRSFNLTNPPPIGASQIVDVAIGEEGTWSIVDMVRSKIFTYNQDGVLLHAFGDTGIQRGNLQKISAITYQNGKLIVLDGSANSFVVYKMNPYGELLLDALECENERRYEDSVTAWLSVLQYNNNFDSAYIGVGRSYYRQGKAVFVSPDGQTYYRQDKVAVYGGEENKEIVGYTVEGIDEQYETTGYDLAMRYLSAAYDTEDWSNAYKEVRKEWISKWFALIPITIVALIVGISQLLKFAGKYNDKVALLGVERKTYVQELMYVFHIIFHPFDGFWDLKHEKRGSVRAALTILGVVILSFYYQSIGTGYVVNPTGAYSTIFAQVLAVGMPFILWCISNWCLTTLFDGEGSFKDVFIATSYALAPLPVFLVVSTLLSNVVTVDEASIVSLLVVLAYVWAGLLLFLGMMVTHDYSVAKNLLMVIVTIVGMAVIMFVGFLFSSLVGKMVSFVSSIVTEISYRA